MTAYVIIFGVLFVVAAGVAYAFYIQLSALKLQKPEKVKVNDADRSLAQKAAKELEAAKEELSRKRTELSELREKLNDLRARQHKQRENEKRTKGNAEAELTELLTNTRRDLDEERNRFDVLARESKGMSEEIVRLRAQQAKLDEALKAAQAAAARAAAAARIIVAADGIHRRGAAADQQPGEHPPCVTPPLHRHTLPLPKVLPVCTPVERWVHRLHGARGAPPVRAHVRAPQVGLPLSSPAHRGTLRTCDEERAMRAAAALLLALPMAALAEPSVSTTVEAPPEKPEVRNWGNLRVGGAVGGGDGRPEICGEFAPLSFLSIEGCGSGAGILHHEAVNEASHYRAKLRLLRFEAGPVLLEPLVGAGMIELQVGKDDAGFRFSDVGPRSVETAGAEAMGALRALLPVGGGFELVSELSVGIGYTPEAPKLVIPMPRTPVFGGLTVGVGF